MTTFFQLIHHPTGAQAASLVPLPGHMPALVKKSQVLGPTDPATPLMLEVGLRLRHQVDLQNYVEAISRPHSVPGRHYLTPAQLTSAFGPLPSSEQAVITYMQSVGFTLTTPSRQHLLTGFGGTVGQAEQAFHLQINNYRAPDGTQFYAPATDPSVPVQLANVIQSINGLDSATRFTHPPILAPRQFVSRSATPHTLNCPQPTSSSEFTTPGEFASAYDVTGLYNAGFHGDGQTVGLFELDDYSSSDIHMYTSCYGGSSVPIMRILVDGGTGHAPGSGAIEVELDMDNVLSAAPHLASLRVYEASNSAAGVLAEWSQIVGDAVPIVSTSWGACEA